MASEYRACLIGKVVHLCKMWQGTAQWLLPVPTMVKSLATVDGEIIRLDLRRDGTCKVAVDNGWAVDPFEARLTPATVMAPPHQWQLLTVEGEE